MYIRTNDKKDKVMDDKRWTWDKDTKNDSDRLLRDYDSVIRESSVLTTFCGFLFGFLLNIAVNSQIAFPLISRIVLLIAITSITVAIALFIMPVFYHHLQYPYRDLEKFKKRAHRFIIFGMAPTMITLYFSLGLALSSVAKEFGFLIAAIPFIFIYVVFRKRK